MRRYDGRLSPIPTDYRDRSNPPPESDDDDEELEYDIYGWFRFDSDAEGVRRLDRQWVPLALAAAGEDWEEKVQAFETKTQRLRENF